MEGATDGTHALLYTSNLTHRQLHDTVFDTQNTLSGTILQSCHTHDDYPKERFIQLSQRMLNYRSC